MERLNFLLVVLVAAVPAASRLETIESAEVYAASRGINLTGKAEDTDQAVAPRAYDYKLGNVEVAITQFATRRAARTWCDVATSRPGIFGDVVCMGLIAFQVVGDEHSERQIVISALKGKTTYKPVAATAPADDVPAPSDGGVAMPLGVLPLAVNGYHDVPWGTHVAYVKARYPDIEVAENGQVFRKEVVADFVAHQVFQFEGEKLKGVRLEFDGLDAPPGMSRRDVEAALRRALESSYGPAKVPADDWFERPTWENAATLVRLLDGIHGSIVVYESKPRAAEVAPLDDR